MKYSDQPEIMANINCILFDISCLNRMWVQGGVHVNSEKNKKNGRG